MTLEQIVKRTIEEKKLIQQGDSLLLGLSGGPDSLCLLHVLNNLKDEMGFKLYALHVNHQIRGAEADQDMMFVIQTCKKLSIPITVKTANIPAIAKKEGIGEEEAGREIRKKALKNRAKEIKGQDPSSRVRIVLAHNKDDQAETVLMRILRGTGVHGLGAMEYEREDGLIRPLLDVPRSLIEFYCQENHLSPRIDSSNVNLEYTRNRLRYRLIPVLEREFNPNLKDVLVRLADSAREDDTYITSQAKKVLPKIETVEDFSSMPKEQLLSMEPAVAKRLVKLMFARSGLKKDISSVHLNKFLEILSTNSNAIVEFPKGYKAVINQNTVYFKGPKDRLPDENRKFKVYCKVIAIEDLPDLKTIGKNTCALDAMKLLALDGDLYLRTRNSGDKIKPLGMNGSKKLTDYMSDEKIPKEIRDDIILLAIKHQILWVEGYTISDLCKVDNETEFVLITRVQED